MKPGHSTAILFKYPVLPLFSVVHMELSDTARDGALGEAQPGA